MQDGKRLILSHVYLVQHSKAALDRALIYGAAPQAYFTVFEGICAYKRRCIGVQVK